VTKIAQAERRLVAIFAADVEASRLMGADEVARLDALTARREILDGLRTQRWIVLGARHFSQLDGVPNLACRD
jgi:hypothetical protein